MSGVNVPWDKDLQDGDVWELNGSVYTYNAEHNGWQHGDLFLRHEAATIGVYKAKRIYRTERVAYTGNLG